MTETQVRNQVSTYPPIAVVQPLGTETAFSRSASVPLIAAITFYGALIAGTGGVFATNNATQLHTWTNWPIVEVRSVPGRKDGVDVYAPSIAEHIGQIRDGFGLKMSEVAQIFGVSRQAAYSWLDGTTPKPEIAGRIWKLGKSAIELKSAGIGDLRHFVHRPLLQDGRSLFGVLLSGGQLDEAIAIAKEVATKEAHMRAEASMRNSEAFNERHSSFMELVKPVLEERNR